MTSTELGAPSARRAPRRPGLVAGSGCCPSSLFAIAFLFLPIAYLVVGSFQDGDGAGHAPELRRPVDRRASRTRIAHSIEISLVTAIGGGIFGFLLAAAVILGGLPADSCATR